jgi:hypothetical protein
MFRKAFFICLVSIHASMASNYAAAADSCQPVFDALTKVVTTPNHTYSSQTGGFVKGKSRSAETIYVQGARYVRVDGSWSKSRLRTEDILQQEKENRANGKATCQFVRNEVVNGKSAMLYALHSENEYTKEDAQMWISKAAGLPLREEMDTDAGGAMGKSHRSMRYEYSDVKPPM